MNFIVFDLEATCWEGTSPSGIQEIIEIGAVKYSRVGERIGVFSELVKPKVNPFLSPYCSDLTGINQSDLESAKDFRRVVNSFCDWIGIHDEEYILCAWGAKDQILLENDCVLHHVNDDWILPYIDLKEQYREIRRLPKKVGLKKCLRMEGFEFEGDAHRALDDTENTVKIFLKFLDMWRY